MQTTPQNFIKFYKHLVYSTAQQNIGLSSETDKSYIIPGNYDCLPWGYYFIINSLKMIGLLWIMSVNVLCKA